LSARKEGDQPGRLLQRGGGGRTVVGSAILGP
jgi:hypothetical protein